MGLQKIKYLKEEMESWKAPNLITEEELIKTFVKKSV